MTKTPLYSPVSTSSFHAGSGRALVVVPSTGSALELDLLTMRMLAACRRNGTLAQQTMFIKDAGVSVDSSQIGERLTRLVAEGLLRAVDTGQLATPVSNGDVGFPIPTLGVITAHRPSILTRCLDTFAQFLQRSESSVSLVVVDGSQDAAHCVSNKSVSETCGAFDRVRYASRSNWQALRTRLCPDGLDPSLLDFGCSPGTVGANRNLLTLLTAGERFISCDDDILCSPRGRHETGARLMVAGHKDLLDTRSAVSRAEALADTHPLDIDVFAAHGDILSHSLEILCEKANGMVDFAHACPHMLAMLERHEQAIVRLTFAGIVGDSGRYCPSRLLFMSDPQRRRVFTDQEVFDIAINGREVRRIAPAIVVTHDPACMAGFMGVCNRALLPPFQPFGRNQDGVFGAMLAHIDPSALFAHLPHAVVHDSGRPARYGDDTMPSARETRLSDIVLSLMRMSSPLLVSGSPSHRLRRLGHWFIDASSLETKDFAAFVSDALMTNRTSDMAKAEACLGPDCPNHWRQHFARYRSALYQNVKHPFFFVPTEFLPVSCPDDGFRRTQAFLRRYGELMRAWPGVWEHSRTLRQA